MNMIQLPTSAEGLWKVATLTLPGARGTKRVKFEIRYLRKTDLWYISMSDVQSGEPYFRYVPVLASSPDSPNNLIEAFWHERIGVIVCYPLTENVTTANPSENNLNEFILLWGDDG